MKNIHRIGSPPLHVIGGRTTQIEYVAKRNVQFGFKCAFFFVIPTFSKSTLALDCENVECREKRCPVIRIYTTIFFGLCFDVIFDFFNLLTFFIFLCDKFNRIKSK